MTVGLFSSFSVFVQKLKAGDRTAGELHAKANLKRIGHEILRAKKLQQSVCKQVPP